jgi:hypothetical protein
LVASIGEKGEQLSGRVGELSTDRFRDGERQQFSRRVIDGGADGGNASTSDLGPVQLAEDEEIADGTAADLLDEEVNLDLLLKAQRPAEIATGAHARPADGGAAFMGVNGGAERAKERVLGLLHHAVEIGEMDDARHVGLGELDAAEQLELVGHGKRKGSC